MGKVPRWELALLLVACVLAAGCMSKRVPKLVPVTGKLSYQGQPVKGVTVQLVADSAAGTHAPSAMGQTDAEGHFMLQSPPHGDGVAPGRYKVTLQQYTGSPQLPARYGNVAQTPLRIEVPEAGLDGWQLVVE
jgi:hypothetical protein